MKIPYILYSISYLLAASSPARADDERDFTPRPIYDASGQPIGFERKTGFSRTYWDLDGNYRGWRSK